MKNRVLTSAIPIPTTIRLPDGSVSPINPLNNPSSTLNRHSTFDNNNAWRRQICGRLEHLIHQSYVTFHVSILRPPVNHYRDVHSIWITTGPPNHRGSTGTLDNVPTRSTTDNLGSFLTTPAHDRRPIW